MMQTEWRRESLVIAQEIRRHAEAKGITPVQFAFAWVLNNRLVTAAIAGPRTLEQFEDYLPALDYRFGADDEALVDSLVRDRPSLDARLQRSRLSDRRPPDLDQAHPTIMIRRLEAADAEARLEELALLLRDAVLGGASIGFVLPLAPAELEPTGETCSRRCARRAGFCSPPSRVRR